MPAVVLRLTIQPDQNSAEFWFATAIRAISSAVLSMALTAVGVSSIVRSEWEPKSDYRTAFSELPAIELPCVPPSRLVNIRDAQNSVAVTVRFDRDKEGKAWLVISNDYPWRESLEIQWNGHTPEVIRPLEKSPPMIVDGQATTEATKADHRGSRWRCDIEPHSHGAWELRALDATITQWQHRAEPAAMMLLENQLATLSRSLTSLTQFRPLADTPRHGGFETTIQGNSVPAGWLVSLNPSTVWQVSDLQAKSGNRSMQFQARQAKAVGWIQSPAFDLPEGGRLAAAAWIRVDPAFPRPKIVTTTTLLKPDGNRQEWKQTCPKNDVSDKNATWYRIDFPTLNSSSLGIPIDPASQVRLAIDIEGPAQLWIDDIFASKIFLDEEERRQLRSELFVARRELSQNRPSLAWRLTQSESFRYVSENVSFTDSEAEYEETQSLETSVKAPGTSTMRQAERPILRRKLR